VWPWSFLFSFSRPSSSFSSALMRSVDSTSPFRLSEISQSRRWISFSLAYFSWSFSSRSVVAAATLSPRLLTSSSSVSHCYLSRLCCALLR